MIKETGGWVRLQSILKVCADVASRLGGDTQIEDVAVAWVLQQPSVAAVIVGGRSANHIHQTLRGRDLVLPTSDLERIDAALGPPMDGDVYDKERDEQHPL